MSLARRVRLLPRWLLAVGVSLMLGCSQPAHGSPNDARSEWSVREGYSLSIVARGLSLPTALAVVPGPRGAPEAPRVFVAELRGQIKVLSNDGKLRPFAKLDTFVPTAEWPDSAGEAGLAGICLDAEHGYVFVTYAYRDKAGVLRNGISRFSAEPKTFAGPAKGRRDFVELLAADRSAFSHQIGNCVTSGDSLYVGTGDGGDPSKSHVPDSLLGKVLRLTLDGAPHPENAFAGEEGKRRAVFAYGLRNPFGLAIADGRLFAAENGVSIDRLLEVRSGGDHAWDGTDATIALNALAVFTPTIGPAQMLHAGPKHPALDPGLTDPFLVTASDSEQGPGVLYVDRDPKSGMLVRAPKYIAHFDGKQQGQGVVGVALAEEGVYFTPILPVGDSGVLMLTRHDPPHAHSKIIGREMDSPLTARGCLGCHTLHGTGGHVGPALDENSLATRVESRVLDPSYAKLVERLDAMTDATLVSGRSARHEVLDAPKSEKVRLWIVNRLINPRFDDPDASMPNLGIGRAEAELIASKLWAPEAHVGLIHLPSTSFLKGVAAGFVAAFGAIAGLAAVWQFVRRRRRGATDSPPSAALASESTDGLA